MSERKDGGETDMAETPERCVAGCLSFDGGEKRHHKDCPFYPESLSKLHAETASLLDEAVEALEWYEKHRLDAIARVGAITAPEDEAVKILCERYGYGAVMDSAARQWAEKPFGSAAFFVGGCIGDETARATLAKIRSKT